MEIHQQIRNKVRDSNWRTNPTKNGCTPNSTFNEIMSIMEADSSSQTSKQPTKRSRHEIWGNFTEIEEMGDAKMRCNECQQLVAKYTTSMKSHWVKKHKDKNQPAKKIRAEVNSELSEPKDKYKRIQSALAAALSIPALPINSFLHPLMRKLFHSLNSNYELPRSFATLKKILLDQYVKTQSKMKADLSTMRQRFSITCDVRFSVTLHYSDQQAFLQRVFLGLKQLEGSHTSFVIRRETEKLLTEYGLNLSSAFKVVTDAGSNMVKGFSDVRAVDVEGECSEQDENDEQEEYAERVRKEVADSFEEVKKLGRSATHCKLYDMYNPSLGDIRKAKSYSALQPNGFRDRHLINDLREYSSYKLNKESGKWPKTNINHRSDVLGESLNIYQRHSSYHFNQQAGDNTLFQPKKLDLKTFHYIGMAALKDWTFRNLFCTTKMTPMT
uniref:BED-type domain-containing protein n=1 Tax=Ditylenchus dipsaci TaxID=166011 RepID=A0A915E7L4_9BILA